MSLEEILESAVSVEKTVWQKRGSKVTRKDVSRLLATTTNGSTDASPAKDAVDGR